MAWELERNRARPLSVNRSFVNTKVRAIEQSLFQRQMDEWRG